MSSLFLLQAIHRDLPQPGGGMKKFCFVLGQGDCSPTPPHNWAGSGRALGYYVIIGSKLLPNDQLVSFMVCVCPRHKIKR